MDVRKWRLDELLMLPDWCFGARWPVITSHRITAMSTAQWLVEYSLPDRFVLWRVGIENIYHTNPDVYVALALGSKSPVTVGDFNTFERLVPGRYENTWAPEALFLNQNGNTTIDCKIAFEAGGRKFAVRYTNLDPDLPAHITIIFTISSVPVYLPDELVIGAFRPWAGLKRLRR